MGRETNLDWETVKTVLVLILVIAAFAFAGTVDHEEEVRHEQWMAQLEEAGEWVMW